MILHIANDEQFIDMGFRLFKEANPGANKLIMATSKKVNFSKSPPLEKCIRNELSTNKFTQKSHNDNA